MSLLYSAAKEFEKLLSIQYHIILSAGKNKPTERINLNFEQGDLYHMLGLQHLDDIAIPRNKNSLLGDILSCKIDDSYLSKSKSYSTGSECNISDRIDMLSDIEALLDSKDTLFYIYRLQHLNKTKIKADYLIVCKRKDNEVYIFIRKRKENDNYGIISCFPRSDTVYWGGKRYLMLKEKVTENTSKELYRHSGFDGIWK